MNLNELTCLTFFAFQISQMGVQNAQIINKLENKLLLSWLLFSSFFWFLYYILTEIEKKKPTPSHFDQLVRNCKWGLSVIEMQVMLNLYFVMMSLKAVLNILLLFLQ